MGKRPRVALHCCVDAQTKLTILRITKRERLPSAGHLIDYLVTNHAR